MNSTNNQTSPIYYMSKQEWLDFFGASILIDTIKVYLFTPLALLGVILNVISFIVFNLKDFRNQPLYSYLRIFTLNSILIEALQATAFLVTAYKYFDFSNTYAALFYYSYLYTPILSTAYFYGTILDVLITLERICQLNKKFTIIKNASPILLSLVSLIFCMIINIPFFMINNVSFIDLNTSPIEFYRFFYYNYSDFASSFAGRLLTYVAYSIRDVFMFMAQVVLGIILIVLVKSYTNRRKRLFNLGQSSTPDQSSLNSEKPQTTANTEMRKRDSKRERKVTLMVVFMCFLCLVEHIFVLVSIVYYYFFIDSFANLLALIASFTIIIKNLSNFFFFFFFNKLFRDKLKRLF